MCPVIGRNETVRRTNGKTERAVSWAPHAADSAADTLPCLPPARQHHPFFSLLFSLSLFAFSKVLLLLPIFSFVQMYV